MMKILGLLFALAFYGSFSHDIRMAVFEIYAGSDGLEMRVSADRYNFIQTLKTEFPHSFCADQMEQISMQYLESKLTIEIDGECSSFEITSIQYSDENIFIKGSLNLKLNEVRQVKMTNTCMIDLLPGHDNIMKLKLNDRIRSFRLNSKRISTVALYND